MATLSYNLSSKVDVNGIAQLYIRITLSKKNRPRLKTGIFARQNWFDPVRGIIPPKKGDRIPPIIATRTLWPKRWKQQKG